ncbi:MAG: phospholipase A [Bacteroidales bacterium]|jgi:phospholipase A1|nr:phospholipase A [Bacteroidales bacterium]
MKLKSIKLTFVILLFIIPVLSRSQSVEVIDSLNISIDNKNNNTSKNNKNKISYTEIDYFSMPSEEIIDLLEKQPSFSIYKNNYFITGIPTNKRISKSTADVKFQLSIKQRLVNIKLPFNSFLYLTYTQKSFWDIYKLSSPFADNNYNPGLLWVTPLVFDNFKGMAALSVEHESNGEGGDDSRGWNFVSLSCSYFVTNCISAQLRLWYGWGLNRDNPDLYEYKGYGLAALNYVTPKERFWCSFIINPCKGFRAFNTQLEVNFRISTKLNQYFFIQWYNGYAENLLEYKNYYSMIRAGICLKPQFRNIY